MDFSSLAALFSLVSQCFVALAAALVVLSKVAQHVEWLSPFCNWVIRGVGKLMPWRRLNEKINELQAAIGVLADQVALNTLQIEMSDHNTKVIVVTDANGEVCTASLSYLHLVDRTLSDVQGTGWLNTVHQPDRAELLHAWQRAVEAHCDFDYDYRIWIPTEGRLLWVSAHARHARNYLNGRIAGWVAVLVPMKNPPGWAGRERLEHERPHHRIGHRPDFETCPEDVPT